MNDCFGNCFAFWVDLNRLLLVVAVEAPSPRLEVDDEVREVCNPMIRVCWDRGGAKGIDWLNDDVREDDGFCCEVVESGSYPAPLSPIEGSTDGGRRRWSWVCGRWWLMRYDDAVDDESMDSRFVEGCVFGLIEDGVVEGTLGLEDL